MSKRKAKPISKKVSPKFYAGATQVIGQSEGFVLVLDSDGSMWRVSIENGYAYLIDWRG